MPELPEVETVRAGLALHLEGRSVVAVRGTAVTMRRPLDPGTIATAVNGRSFVAARRRAKYLLLDFDCPGSLLVHLGMTGNFSFGEPDSEPPRHSHLVFELDNGIEMRFSDPRRFGFAHWLSAGEEQTDPALRKLGVEPLREDLAEILPDLYRGRRSAVKTLLLDQRLVAGIGNIYAAEVLWRVGIRPSRPGHLISRRRLVNLAEAIRTVLKEAIEQGGTTLRDFASPDGSKGYFSIRLDAYGREGEPCRRCERVLSHSTIGGRTTAWCQSCQR